MYDLIIIGGGPAGMTASIYASCFHLNHLIIAKDIGGQLLLAPDILNYPGFPEITGKELAARMLEQLKARGGRIVSESVVKISKTDGMTFKIETQEGNNYQTKSVILATGTERKKLGIPGEVEYTAKGVHYCATCEKQDYGGKVCAVVGGANSAVQAAVELSAGAKKVYIIYRGTQLRGDHVWIEGIEKSSNIEIICNTIVTEIVGDGNRMTGIKLKTNLPPGTSATGQKLWNGETLPAEKVFVEIGGVPGTALIIPLGAVMDDGKYIRVNERLETSIPGIFAAGDLVSSELSIEQISSAVGLGARAAASAFAFIEQEKAPSLWGASRITR